ncbi:hypothetical protein [Streptomyces sp. 1331.2]|uniref:hypothetical protein n=1 Tax=Streptomyces sp. 1331.2 TaxID=1938835 RepID=UPI00211CEA15|nr:hypothetical protein [Streptomyces sp. 1331.2]
MSNWEFVKDRTATQGAVWRSADGLLYKRTGGEDLRAEIEFQQLAASLGYPVPEIVDSGSEDGRYFVVERAIGDTSLHEEALADAGRDGRVSYQVISTAAAVTSKLLQAQARHPLPATPWFEKAAFAAEVFEEKPDLDTPRVHEGSSTPSTGWPVSRWCTGTWATSCSSSASSSSPSCGPPTPRGTTSTSSGSTGAPSSRWDLISMSRATRSTPAPCPLWNGSPLNTGRPVPTVRDRDYLMDHHGVVFKVIGDSHPGSHYRRVEVLRHPRRQAGVLRLLRHPGSYGRVAPCSR